MAALLGVPLWVVVLVVAALALALLCGKSAGEVSGYLKDLQVRHGLSLSDGSLRCFGNLTKGLIDINRFPWLYTAFELGLFEMLQDAPHSAKQVAEKTKVKGDWPLESCLQVMADEGIFQRKQEGQETLYWHSIPTAAVKELRDHAEMFHTICYRQFHAMADSIRKNEAVGLQRTFPGAKSLLHATELHPEAEKGLLPWQRNSTETFMQGLLSEVNFGAYGSVLDFCGGSAAAAVQVAKACPDLAVTVLDSAARCRDLDKVCTAAGLPPTRIKACAVDMSAPFDLPETFDCVMMVNCLQYWGEKDHLRFFAAIKKALKPGGQLILLNSLDGPHNTEAALKMHAHMSAMLFCCNDATTKISHVDDISRLLKIAGFSAIDYFLCPSATPAPPTVLRAS